MALRIAGFSHPNFYRPDPWRGWSLRPGVEGPWRQEGASWVRVNRFGMREEEIPEAKPPGVVRIAVLGDSCVEALQVPHEETFPELLERRLAGCAALGGRRVEALNFGVSGYGTAQELLTLRREVWRFHPDLVLLAFYPGNDVANNSRAIDGNPERPYCLLRPAGARSEATAAGAGPPRLDFDLSFREAPGFRFRRSALGRLVYGIADRSRLLQLAKPVRVAVERARARRRRAEPAPREAGLDEAIYRPPSDPRWQEAWRTTEALIGEMRREAEAHAARFGVVVLTSGIQVHPDPAVRSAFAARLGVPDLLYPDRRLQDLGQREGFPVLSLAPPLADEARRGRLFFHGFPNTEPGLGHWNADGHRAAARFIAPWLCQELGSGDRRDGRDLRRCGVSGCRDDEIRTLR